mgnify:CR=1 FL=1|jgi:hypothetical protein
MTMTLWNERGRPSLLTLNIWVRELTAFRSFLAMVNDPYINYHPTLRPDLDTRYEELAYYYNLFQAGRDDPRRAYVPKYERYEQ